MLLLGIGQTIFAGVVLSKLWLWYIVRTFDVKPLSVIGAIGVLFIVEFLLFTMTTRQSFEKLRATKYSDLDDDEFTIVKKLFMILGLYPLTLGLAYVWQLFM